MKQQYKNYYQFTKPPKALLKAHLDTIAIVPASMLPLKATWQKVANKLPRGGVLLYHSPKKTRQRKLLKRLENVFKQHGHVVMNLSMEQVL
jgi:hypothetical protein